MTGNRKILTRRWAKDRGNDPVAAPIDDYVEVVTVEVPKAVRTFVFPEPPEVPQARTVRHDDALFLSTPQALAVAFTIHASEVAQDGMLRKALIRILEAVEEPTKRQMEWLVQLRGERSATVNFSGLVADEIRAQCALITQTVRDHLVLPERHAILGAYTHVPMEKAAAVRFLSEYIKPDADNKKRLLYDYCVLRSIPNKYGNENVRSLKELGSFGVSDKSAAAYLREFRKKYKALRVRGEAVLDSLFRKHGVVYGDD